MKTKSLAIVIGCLVMAGCNRNNKLSDTASNMNSAPLDAPSIAANAETPAPGPIPSSTPNNDLNKSNPAPASTTAPP